MIYKPAEDSYLLEETIKDYLKDKDKSIKIIDMGSGSGIQAKACKDLGFENVLAVDINPEAVAHLKEQKLNVIKSDLFSEIKKEYGNGVQEGAKPLAFDLIVFNPPYLPEDKREPEDSKLATTAGKKGYEIIIRFLKDVKNYLSDNGRILLLFSSLSKPEIIINKSKEFGYKNNLLKSLKLDFEELFVYEFRL